MVLWPEMGPLFCRKSCWREELVLMVDKWAHVDVYPGTYDETFVGRRTLLLNDHSQITSHQLTFTECPLQIYQMNVSYRDIGGGGAIHCFHPPYPSHSLLSHPCKHYLTRRCFCTSLMWYLSPADGSIYNTCPLYVGVCGMVSVTCISPPIL